MRVKAGLDRSGALGLSKRSAAPGRSATAWKTFEDGTPQPNWTALIREDRDRGH